MIDTVKSGCEAITAGIILLLVLSVGIFLLWWIDPTSDMFTAHQPLTEQNRQLQNQVYDLQTAVAKKDSR